MSTDLRVLEYDRRRTQVVAQRTLPQPRVERGLFSLGLGPDGALYGGAFQSMHLFRFDPHTDELRDLGDHHPGWSGEIYSVCARGCELVCCSYINGAVVLYDPAQPWVCDHQRKANPRFAGCFGEFTYRPFACLADRRGRIWAVGYACWGITGGGVSWLDPDTGETGTTHLPTAPFFIVELSPGLLLIADETKLRWWDAAANTELAAYDWPHAPVQDVALLAPDRLAFVTNQHLHFAEIPSPRPTHRAHHACVALRHRHACCGPTAASSPAAPASPNSTPRPANGRTSRHRPHLTLRLRRHARCHLFHARRATARGSRPPAQSQPAKSEK